MDKDFNFSMVPHGWALYYLGECNRKEECMCYQMCMLATEEDIFDSYREEYQFRF